MSTTEESLKHICAQIIAVEQAVISLAQRFVSMCEENALKSEKELASERQREDAQLAALRNAALVVKLAAQHC